jgi:CRP-like cAMP-binding protein
MDEKQRLEVGAFLRQGEWFGGLPAALQRRLLDVAVLRSWPKGHTIQVEDEPVHGLVAILDGQVAMVRHVGDGEPALIHVATPGFWFGDSAVLAGAAVVSAIAQTAVRGLLVPVREVERILADEPRFYPCFFENTLVRLKFLLRYFAETARLSPEYRLRLRLADLADMRRGETTVPGRAVELDITQAELAQIVGLSRQRLNARLKALQKEGWIALGPRRIRVLNPNGLRASASTAFAQPAPVSPFVAARFDAAVAGDARRNARDA